MALLGFNIKEEFVHFLLGRIVRIMFGFQENDRFLRTFEHEIAGTGLTTGVDDFTGRKHLGKGLEQTVFSEFPFFLGNLELVDECGQLRGLVFLERTIHGGQVFDFAELLLDAVFAEIEMREYLLLDLVEHLGIFFGKNKLYFVHRHVGLGTFGQFKDIFLECADNLVILALKLGTVCGQEAMNHLLGFFRHMNVVLVYFIHDLDKIGIGMQFQERPKIVQIALFELVHF